MAPHASGGGHSNYRDHDDGDRVDATYRTYLGGAARSQGQIRSGFSQANQMAVPAGPDPSLVSIGNPQLGSASGQ